MYGQTAYLCSLRRGLGVVSEVPKLSHLDFKISFLWRIKKLDLRAHVDSTWLNCSVHNRSEVCTFCSACAVASSSARDSDSFSSWDIPCRAWWSFTIDLLSWRFLYYALSIEHILQYQRMLLCKYVILNNIYIYIYIYNVFIGRCYSVNGVLRPLICHSSRSKVS